MSNIFVVQKLNLSNSVLNVSLFIDLKNINYRVSHWAVVGTNLELNVDKTKEIVVDFKKHNTGYGRHSTIASK